MTEERWKQVEQSNYYVSDYGRVIGLHGFVRMRTIKGRRIIKFGARYTTLSVHRLVAHAFIANPNNYPLVRFKDGNMLNCHWTNLEWVPRPAHSGICRTCKLPKPPEAFDIIHSKGPTKYRRHECMKCQYQKVKRKTFEKILTA